MVMFEYARLKEAFQGGAINLQTVKAAMHAHVWTTMIDAPVWRGIARAKTRKDH